MDTGAEGEREPNTVTRYLFVTPPLVGHIVPLIGVAERLRAHGDRVAWVGDERNLRFLLPAQSAVHPATTPRFRPRPPHQRGFAALRALWTEFLVPLAEAMVPDVRRAVADFLPDVLVVDQQALAGALVAERLGLPWATSASTSSELSDPLAALPKVAAWLAGLIADLRLRHGDPDAPGDPRFSPYLVLAFSTPELAGPARVDAPVAFVGPSLPPPDRIRRAAVPLVDAARPLVYAALGTVNADAGPFLTTCARALGERPDLQAVIADPRGSIRRPPTNVITLPYTPQLEIMAMADVVVCHGGHNTVCEALAFGAPLIVAPIRDDQPIIADQVVRAGAGVRVRFDRVDAAQIGEALELVLTDPQFRRCAARIRDSFEAAGGAEAAAERLAALVNMQVG